MEQRRRDCPSLEVHKLTAHEETATHRGVRPRVHCQRCIHPTTTHGEVKKARRCIAQHISRRRRRRVRSVCTAPRDRKAKVMLKPGKRDPRNAPQQRTMCRDVRPTSHLQMHDRPSKDTAKIYSQPHTAQLQRTEQAVPAVKFSTRKKPTPRKQATTLTGWNDLFSRPPILGRRYIPEVEGSTRALSQSTNRIAMRLFTLLRYIRRQECRPSSQGSRMILESAESRARTSSVGKSSVGGFFAQSSSKLLSVNQMHKRWSRALTSILPNAFKTLSSRIVLVFTRYCTRTDTPARSAQCHVKVSSQPGMLSFRSASTISDIHDYIAKATHRLPAKLINYAKHIQIPAFLHSISQYVHKVGKAAADIESGAEEYRKIQDEMTPAQCRQALIKHKWSKAARIGKKASKQRLTLDEEEWRTVQLRPKHQHPDWPWMLSGYWSGRKTKA